MIRNESTILNPINLTLNFTIITFPFDLDTGEIALFRLTMNITEAFNSGIIYNIRIILPNGITTETSSFIY